MQKQYLKLLLIILINTTTYSATQWKNPDPRLRLDQISVLGAHNSLMAKDDKWIYAQQKWTLTKLLDEGVRSFEIDLATLPNKDQLFVCHGVCDTFAGKAQKLGSFDTLQSKMKIFTDWLKQHPDQVIFLMLDIGRDKAMKTNQFDMNMDMLPADQKNLILTPADWLPEDHGGEWPTLQWMIDQNKRIVIFNLKEKDSPRYSYYHVRYISTSGTSPRKDDYTTLSGKSQEAEKTNQGKVHRMFQLSQSNFLSEQYALDAYNAYRKADLAKSKLEEGASSIATQLRLRSKSADNKTKKKREEAQKQVDKLLNEVPASDYLTIAQIVADCKDAKLMGGMNPNILQIDWVDQFVTTDGLKMINQWNDEASKNLSIESSKARDL